MRRGHKVLVVGAGFSGASCARKLAEAGVQVTVCEARNHLGGNSADHFDDRGAYIQDYGPHIFHTSIKGVWDFLSRFCEWHLFEHKVRGFVCGKLIPIPFNFESIDLCFEPSEAEELKFILKSEYGLDERIPIGTLFGSSNPKITQLAQFIFEHVFKHYSAKAWGVDAETLSPQVISRVPIVMGYAEGYFQDDFQGVPKQGFTTLVKNMLSHPNIKVVLNSNQSQALKSAVSNSKGSRLCVGDFDSAVYTGSLDEIIPEAEEKLPYRSIDFQFEALQQEFFQEYAVINYPETEDFTRITEFKHFLEQKEICGTTILKEYSLDWSAGFERCYPVDSPESKALYEKFYNHLKQFSNLYFCGRLALYKYLNIDQSVECGLEVADTILKSFKDK